VSSPSSSTKALDGVGIQVIVMSGVFSGDDVPPAIAADAFYEKSPIRVPCCRLCKSFRGTITVFPPTSAPNQDCAELT
jgi:hypothetical protein